MDARGWIRVLGVMGLVVVLSGCQPFLSKVRTYSEDKEASNLKAAQMQKQCDAVKARQISIEEEYSFGGAVSVNWVSQGGGLLLPTPGPRKDPPERQLNLQLNKIGRNLAAQSSRPNLVWTFGVLKSPGINAVSGPGGYVFVSEGLLARLDDEAELAGVLAHEITHITNRHALNEFHAYLDDECQNQVETEKGRVEKELRVAGVSGVQQGLSRGLGDLTRTVAPGVVKDFFAQVGTRVNALDAEHMDRALFQAFADNFVARLSDKGLPEQAEYDADQGAVELMAAAGYQPQAYIEFLGKLPDTGLSTSHPRKELRQERLRAWLDARAKERPSDEFTTPVNLTNLRRSPLRDALLIHVQAAAAPAP